jgi:cell wall-associated NlpC family hydrolase
MSVVDMVGRMAEIRSSISQLNAPAVAAPANSAEATSATDATAAKFAEVLTAASTGTAAVAAPVVPGAGTGADVAEAAKKYLGVPYVWGGTDPKTGLDCSGLVQRVYKDLGIDVPRVTYDQIKTGTTVPNLAAAKPGDLLFMHNVSHVGIYMGDNKYIHAPVPGQNVRIDEIPAGAVFDKIQRIIPEKAAIATPAAGSMTDIIAAAQASLLKGAA